MPTRGVQNNGSAFGNYTVKPKAFRRGTSQTVVLSEVIQGQGSDSRGAIMTVLPGGSLFMSRLTPNSGSDTYQYETAGGDALWADLCDNSNSDTPCFSMGDDIEKWMRTYAGARSYHSGGVNAGYGDGSVHFISNQIDPELWHRLNSTGDF
jgi:prepilin-type processing-associated H-X9-DG protein